MTPEKILNLSKEQKLAADVSRNIAVSAGAGSGKTTVLTRRFLNLLEADLSMDQIGAITFTEKAALEMKERIRKAVNEKISSSSFREKDMWMIHLNDLGSAGISTIHSFCAGIVRENAAYLGIDFNFSIINEMDKNYVLGAAVQGALSHCLSNKAYCAAFEKITRCYGREYIYGSFTEELLRLRLNILDKALDFEEVFGVMEDGSPERLCMDIIIKADLSYMQYKTGHDVLDYNDLENMALAVLENQDLRERYKNRFRTLLIDEFQDTNQVQKSIIYSIAADDQGVIQPGRLFVVGDFKQSIYGFRGTDYTIFRSVAEDIGDQGRVSLNICYRSKNEIIYEVNSIFKALIEDYEALKCPKDYELKEKRVNLITYQRSRTPDTKVIVEVKKALQGKPSSFESIEDAFKALREGLSAQRSVENSEGIAAAKSVKFLMDKGLSFKDICILVRSRYVIPEIEEELKLRGVPYYVAGGRGFYQKSEIEEILNLYKVVVRGFSGVFKPSETRDLIMALRGPFFQIPDSLLLKAKLERDESRLSNLFEAVDHVMDGMSDCEGKSRLKKTYDILNRLSELKERLSAPELFRAIIDRCSVFDIMLSSEGGIQKVRNIEKLLHEVEKIDGESLFTHEEFVRYIDRLYVNETEDSEAFLYNEDADAVRIMTIHQAKGLEFNGVIIPRIHSDLLSMSRIHKPGVVFHNGRLIFSRNLYSGDESKEYRDYNTERLLKEIDENIRLLYVAMTRARDYIVLSGEDDGRGNPGEINEVEDKIKNLNTFLKMIKYAINIKDAKNELIGFYNAEELCDFQN